MMHLQVVAFTSGSCTSGVSTHELLEKSEEVNLHIWTYMHVVQNLLLKKGTNKQPSFCSHTAYSVTARRARHIWRWVCCCNPFIEL